MVGVAANEALHCAPKRAVDAVHALTACHQYCHCLDLWLLLQGPQKGGRHPSPKSAVHAVHALIVLSVVYVVGAAANGSFYLNGTGSNDLSLIFNPPPTPPIAEASKEQSRSAPQSEDFDVDADVDVDVGVNVDVDADVDVDVDAMLMLPVKKE